MTADSTNELEAWLRLLLAPGLGRGPARRLLAAFGSPQAIFDNGPAAWSKVVDARCTAALATPADHVAACVETTAAWLAQDAQRAIVTLGDAVYPDALLQTEDPPLLLHVQGRAELLARDSLAIVGSRNPTAQGSANAHAFGKALSRCGWTVVSGLALGIDAAAHEGALDGEGDGSTIAVVGTGLDRVYPARHRALAHRIAAHGLLVSEFPLGTPPIAGNFPMRNRIIAGLSRGTLVVEAALKSGSLITARLALEAGREVFAVPGSIHAPQSRGCHALLRQGAKLVESAQDILDELQGGQQPTTMPATDREPAPADPVLDALGHDPATVDALLARTGWPTADLTARLLQLELDGQLARLPGGLYQRLSRA
jgi:DNA processing protein